jgi:hypothetical protein
VGRENVCMEHEAFTEMLQKRTNIRPDGSVVFMLYPKLTLDSCLEEWVVKGTGTSYLRMDCLRNE